MNKGLQPGTWCRPSSEKEWKAILELAVAMGISQTDPPRMNYSECKGVWADLNSNVAQCFADGPKNGGWMLTYPEPDTVSYFLSCMAKEAI